MPDTFFNPKNVIENHGYRLDNFTMNLYSYSDIWKIIRETNNYGILLEEIYKNTLDMFEYNYTKVMQIAIKFYTYYRTRLCNPLFRMYDSQTGNVSIQVKPVSLEEIDDYLRTQNGSNLIDIGLIKKGYYISRHNLDELNVFFRHEEFWEGTGLWEFINEYRIELVCEDFWKNFMFFKERYEILVDPLRLFEGEFYRISSRNFYMPTDYMPTETMNFHYHDYRTERWEPF